MVTPIISRSIFGPTRRWDWLAVLAMVGTFVISLVVFVVVTQQWVPLNHPPFPNDAADYENIAFNLWKGRGFGFDWNSPEWRQPYEAWNQSGIYDELLGRWGGFVPTTYRPPALPLCDCRAIRDIRSAI